MTLQLQSSASLPQPDGPHIVGTPEELQQAVGLYPHIEVRQHLDLRQLHRKPKARALLHADPTLQSLRGNCSEPWPPAMDGIDRAAQLPLRPFQCFLVVGDSWLAFTGGRLWLDNVYLRLSRQNVNPGATFITSVSPPVAEDGNRGWVAGAPAEPEARGMYVTNVTLHAELAGESKRSAVGVRTERGSRERPNNTEVFLEDCILTDWGGELSPLTIVGTNAATVRNTTFRNMKLQVEIADVSFGGSVRFEGVSLKGHTGPAVVGTTSKLAPYDDDDCYLYYDAYVEDWVDDQEGDRPCRRSLYDVLCESAEDPCPGGQHHTFAADDCSIRNETMSDCLFLQDRLSLPLPGCPAESVPARNATRLRESGRSALEIKREESLNCTKVVPTPPPTGSEAWIAAVREKLPPRPPVPPDWPQLELAPPLHTDAPLKPPASHSDTPPRFLPRLLPPFQPCSTCTSGSSPPQRPLPPSADFRNGVGSKAVAAVFFSLAVLVAALSVVLLRRSGACTHWPRRTRRTPPRQGSPDSDGYRHRVVPHSVSVKDADVKSEKLPATGVKIPACALNPDYEFQLPPHVGLLEHTQSLPRDYSAATSARAYSAATSARAYSRNTEASIFSAAYLPGSSSRMIGGSARVHSGSSRFIPRTGILNLPQSAADAPPARDADTITSVGLPLPPDNFAQLSPVPSVDCNQCTVSWLAIPAPLALGRTDGACGMHVPSLSRPSAAPLAIFPVHSADDDGLGDPASAGLLELPAVELVSSPSVSVQLAERDVSFANDTLQLVPDSADSPHFTANTFTPGPSITEQRRRSSDTGNSMFGTPFTLRTSLDSAGSAEWASGRGHAWIGQKQSTKVPASRPALRTVTQGDSSSQVLQTRVRQLHRQLDLFGEGDVFMGRFSMLGRHQRRHGGQGLIQFADGCSDGCQYAVKFFLSDADYRAEAALYAASQPVLFGGDAGASAAPPPDSNGRTGEDAAGASSYRHFGDGTRFLPQVEAVCEDALDPHGVPLPPCIVMEKGESLQDWSTRAEPDLFTSVAVLSNVSQRLADMHAAGFVHRDLKPANVMWLPRENRWTVIDFGCVARLGDQAPLNFTLAYAAPEVIAACTAGERTILATPAVDAWSLGVMAFELLTGAPAFQLVTQGSQVVVEMLRGTQPLPWEGDLSAQHAERLGALKGAVLQLLNRDPDCRLDLHSFNAACSRGFCDITNGGVIA